VVSSTCQIKRLTGAFFVPFFPSNNNIRDNKIHVLAKITILSCFLRKKLLRFDNMSDMIFVMVVDIVTTIFRTKSKIHGG
jgi:hypothetical protein